MKRTGAQTNLRSHVVFTDEESRRIRALVARVGYQNAARMLKIGEPTLDAARDQGRMLAKTKVRILETLEQVEREAS